MTAGPASATGALVSVDVQDLARDERRVLQVEDRVSTMSPISPIRPTGCRAANTRPARVAIALRRLAGGRHQYRRPVVRSGRVPVYSYMISRRTFNKAVGLEWGWYAVSLTVLCVGKSRREATVGE